MLLPQKAHFSIENGFVVLLIVEKSFMELVASGREGQCLGEKFCYVSSAMPVLAGSMDWRSLLVFYCYGAQRKDKCIG